MRGSPVVEKIQYIQHYFMLNTGANRIQISFELLIIVTMYDSAMSCLQSILFIPFWVWMVHRKSPGHCNFSPKTYTSLPIVAADLQMYHYEVK